MGGVTLGRMGLDKTFMASLRAVAKGKCSVQWRQSKALAGYVAIEQVVGKCGKQGSFVLQHFGIMTDGQNRLILEVVPHSGAGELQGLTGTMAISIENGQHFMSSSLALKPALSRILTRLQAWFLGMIVSENIVSGTIV